MHFSSFSELLPFLLESKINYFFCLAKQLRYASYGLKTCCSYLGSIKHICTSIVKQTISTSQVVQSFSFFLVAWRGTI